MGLTSRKKRLLKKEIPHLRDTSLIIIASEGEVADACSRAEQMDNNPQYRWPENHGSHVYRLVKDINALTGNRSDCQ